MADPCASLRLIHRLDQEATLPQLTYSVPEVADLLGISRTSAYEAVRRGDIPALAFGRRIVVTRSVLEDLLGPLPERHDDLAHDKVTRR